VVELDLSGVEPSVAGPRRPQDRVAVRDVKRSFSAALETFGVAYEGEDEAVAETFPASDPTAYQEPRGGGPVSPPPNSGGAPVHNPSSPIRVSTNGDEFELDHGRGRRSSPSTTRRPA
jgi:aconitate hydratase